MNGSERLSKMGQKISGNLADVGFDGTFFFFCLLSDRAVLDK
jgi:hypothetical protein